MRELVMLVFSSLSSVVGRGFEEGVVVACERSGSYYAGSTFWIIPILGQK